MTKGQKVLSFYLTLAAGFAMFSMFFGSGNLVFPINVGYKSGGGYFWATLGLGFTAVVVPFLGLYAMLLFNGSYEKFFSRLDKYSAFLLPLLILSLIGPFGVIPRTITVAYGSFATLFPNIPLWLFSVLFSFTTLLLVFNTRYIVPFLGLVLTPLLLISLLAIVAFALFTSVPIGEVHFPSVWSSFSTGMLQGYNTMDLMASFFFAYVIINYVKAEVHTKVDCKKRQQRIELSSMILAAGLLTVIYAAFVYLGFKYNSFLNSEHVEQAIAVIAQVSLGKYAGAIVTAAVILANLTTAIALTIVSAEFFRDKVFMKKISRTGMLIAVLIISAIISNFEFSGIFAFLAPILVAIYPGLIVLTIINIIDPKFRWKVLTIAFYLSIFLSVAYSLTPQS